MLLELLVLRGGRFIVRSVLLLYRMSFVLMKLLVVWMFVVLGGSGQRLTRKHFDRRANRGRKRCDGGLRLLVWMAVIVVLEVFEDVADVKKSVAVETDVHESGLHARQDAGDFSFVNAADEREFFFPLDVDFD